CPPGASGWRCAATATRAGCSTTPASATAAAGCGRWKHAFPGPASSTWTSGTARSSATSASPRWSCTPPAPGTARSRSTGSTPTTPGASSAGWPSRWTVTTRPRRGRPAAAPAGTGAATRERRLHRWSWLFVLLQQLRQFIVPLLVLGFLGRGGRYALWPLVGVAVLAAASIWRYFTYRYHVDGDRLVVREGLLERQVRQIPFARIHNVALHQTLLHRVFGVAEVRLESAGGNKPEAEMRVLRMGEALALERLIRSHGAAAANADPDALEGEGAADHADGRLLLSLQGVELVRLGLVSNRGMVVVAGAFAVSWQVLPDHMLSS